MKSCLRFRSLAAAFIVTLLSMLAFTTGPAAAFEQRLADELEERLRDPFDGDIDALLERGYIRVLIPFSKTIFFIDKGIQRGTAVDAVTELGKHLDKVHGKKAKGLKLVIIPTARDRLFQDLAENRGDLAFGNLTISADRQKLVDFSAPLFTGVLEVPVTTADAPDLTAPEELSGKRVHVRRSSSYFESLTALNTRLESAGKAPVELVEAEDFLEDEDLMELVSAGGIDMVIVDKHKADLWIQVLPSLKTHEAAAVRTDGEIAIAVRKGAPKLLEEINAFTKTVKKGTLLGNIIFKRYLANAEYLKDMRQDDHDAKLDGLAALFRKYAETYQIDWLLIAAQAFQESRFDQGAKSHAGAVGLMQIKPSTAKGDPINITGIAEDADKNVQAGVKYLRFLANQYFPDLESRNAQQTFFALAAYNAGPSRFGKLRDKAKAQGYDPDKWFGNVEWVVAAQIGREPVDYVGNIYQYYVVFNNERERRQREGSAGAAAGDPASPPAK